MKTSVQSTSKSVRAAEYLRMSDEAQQYSIDNQKAAIRDYAAQHGLEIVKTYADAGRSGVTARRRPALAQLLKDVVSGNPGYQAILVYDVSRWGRYLNNDEAAHYEFICSNSGIPLHYCAEPFQNDGTASSSILKALKRSMAAEFSRELGEKVFRGKSRIVELGFWVGGKAGYGYRRMMVSKDGKPKQILKFGERKSLTTDRVVLVRGPRHEVEVVRLIFSLAIKGLGPTEIARRLNRDGINRDGKAWEPLDVRNIVMNPKYAGCNVWNRGTQRLRTSRVLLDKQKWIMKARAFEPIIDQKTFDLAQSARPKRADAWWSDSEILRKLRRLLAAKGRLSETLIKRARGMPSTTTLHDHFGTYREMYKLVGFDISEEDEYGNETQRPAMNLRRQLVRRIRNMFPENVSVTHLPHHMRSMLRIDDTFLVSVLLCPPVAKRGQRRWIVRNLPAERNYVTLLCRVSSRYKRILSYHVFPNIKAPWKTHYYHDKDPWLCSSVKLTNLSMFYNVVSSVFRQESA